MHAVLDHPDLDQRHVAHLPHEHPGRRRVRQLATTVSARLRLVVDHLVRVGDQLHRNNPRPYDQPPHHPRPGQDLAAAFPARPDPTVHGVGPPRPVTPCSDAGPA